MTRMKKDLIRLLLQEDHYMVKAINAKGKKCIKFLKDGRYRFSILRKLLLIKMKDLLKSDDKKRMTLNLNLVRQLHGKNYIKMLYIKKGSSQRPLIFW